MSEYKPWELLAKALPETAFEDFGFELPILNKAEHKVSGRRYIQGVASTPATDLQSESVVQKGMDLGYFLEHGYFNDDHKPGNRHKVGQPTRAEIKKVKDRSGKSVMGLWVEGYIWPKGSHQGADDIWELCQALEIADADRKMGFSIQGKVLQREGNKILKAWIQDIAITPAPVNTASWLDVVRDFDKSWASTQEISQMVKSIDIGRIDAPDIGFPDDPDEDLDEKALTAGGGTILAPESLEGGQRTGTYRKEALEQESMNKSLRLTYLEARRRGHDADTAKRLTVALAARSILLS